MVGERDMNGCVGGWFVMLSMKAKKKWKGNGFQLATRERGEESE